MGRRKLMTTVYLEPRQVDAIAALAKVDGEPKAAIFRAAVDAYLRARAHEIPATSPDPRQEAFDFKGKDADTF